MFEIWHEGAPMPAYGRTVEEAEEVAAELLAERPELGRLDIMARRANGSKRRKSYVRYSMGGRYITTT